MSSCERVNGNGNNAALIPASTRVFGNPRIPSLIFACLGWKDQGRANGVCKRWREQLERYYSLITKLNIDFVMTEFPNDKRALATMSVFTRCRNLQALTVPSDASVKESVHYAPVLFSLAHCRNLQQLDLRPASPYSFEELVTFGMLTGCDKVTKLWTPNRFLLAHDIGLLAREFPALEELYHANSVNFETLRESLPLRKLSLTLPVAESLISPYHTRQSVQQLKELPTFRSVSIENAKIWDGFVIYLITKMPNLVELELKNCPVSLEQPDHPKLPRHEPAMNGKREFLDTLLDETQRKEECVTLTLDATKLAAARAKLKEPAGENAEGKKE